MKQLVLLLFIAVGVLSLTQVYGSGGDKGQQPSAGELVFKKYHCNACHGDKGVGVGDLRKAWLKYNNEQLRAYISKPSDFNNMKMPTFGPIIAEQDWPVLLEYVRKLGKDAAEAAVKQ